jgi:hypothetical protein
MRFQQDDPGIFMACDPLHTLFTAFQQSYGLHSLKNRIILYLEFFHPQYVVFLENPKTIAGMNGTAGQ